MKDKELRKLIGSRVKQRRLEMFMEANEGRDLRDRGNVKAVTRTVAN